MCSEFISKGESMEISKQKTTQNNEAKQYFSEKAAGYYEEHYKNITSKTVYPSLYLRHQYVLEMLNNKPGKALDIGCGSGAMVRDLLDRGFEIVAADISDNMLEATKKTVCRHSRAKNVNFTVQDIEALTLPSETFDLIICLGVIEYLKTDEFALKEIARVLKSGGCAFISTQNKASIARTAVEIAFAVLPKSIVNKIVVIKQHHCHVPWRLDKQLADAGLQKIDFAYHHFYPMPIPLDRIFKRLAVWLGKKMELWHKKSWAWMFATGYIVKVKKVL